MNKARKMIAVLLSLCVLLTTMTAVFSAENFDDDGNRDNETGLGENEQNVLIQGANPQHELDNPDDAYREGMEYDVYIKGRNEYDERVRKLTALGVWVPIDEGSYLEPIRAGEFFLSVCRYIDSAYFYDGNAEKVKMWEMAYTTLKDLGYVDYDIDYMGKISYDAALRTLVNAFGHKPAADEYGGTSTAYMRVASRYGIAKRFPNDRDKAIIRTDAAALIEESLGAQIYVQYGADKNEKADALEYFKETHMITGIVESVSDKTITGEGTADNGIKIGNTVLISDRRNLYNYLACRVEAYYKKDSNGDNALLHISYHKNNTIMTIEGEDINGVTSSGIQYYSDNKLKRASLSSSAKEILNGFSPKPIDKEDFYSCDYIRLVDNDNSSGYDVVFVYKYDIMFVERFVESQKMVYGVCNGNENGALKLDLDNCDMSDRRGNPVDTYYITENSVLSAARDAQTGETKVIVSNLMYTGTVKSVIEDEITFEDREYKYSPSCNYQNAQSAIKSGNKYTVYLDYRGRIAGFDLLKTDDIQYGFLIMACLRDAGSSAAVKLFPYKGDAGDFKLAQSTRIDGSNCRDAQSMFNALKTAADYQRETLSGIDTAYVPMEDYCTREYVYVRTPVMYKLNANGEIKYIDTPYHGNKENPEGSDVFNDNTMTMYNDFSERTASLKPGGMYLRNTLAFGGDNGNNVAINNSTKVFVVPVSNDKADIRDKSQYIRTNLAYFNDWVYYPQTGTQFSTENRLEAYNVDDSRTAGIIVYYTSDVVPEIDKKVPLTVVDEIAEAIDEEGYSVRRLVGWQGNAPIQVNIADGVYLKRSYNGAGGKPVLSEVKHGDIIRYVTNEQGELVDYVKVFSLKDEDDPEYVKTGNETGKTVDASTLNKTMLAVSDGKYTQNSHNTTHIYNTIGSYNYGAPFRLVYGTLLYRNGKNLVLKTRVDTALGQTEKIEIADFSGYNVLLIDEAADRIYVPTEDDLLTEQGAGAAASKIIVHTEGGKQRQLIIIKRA